MEDNEAYVLNLSDEQLRKELFKVGEQVGPVTGTTKKFFQRKLLKHLTGEIAETKSVGTEDCSHGNANESGNDEVDTKTEKPEKEEGSLYYALQTPSMPLNPDGNNNYSISNINPLM